MTAKRFFLYLASVAALVAATDVLSGLAMSRYVSTCDLPGDYMKITHMLRSGDEDILILADDLSLPVGTMRFRPKGSSGGHNGLKSVIAHLGGDDFPRLKIGIGAADGDVIDHVLGRFSKEEWEKVSSMLELSVDAVKLWLESGSEAVMNRYNVYSRLPKKKKEADDGGKETAKKDVPPLIPLNGKATEER